MAGRQPARGMTRWLVDASNVIGSRPDGWWRDRQGAAQRLIDALREFAGEGDDVVVVLDAGRPRGPAGRAGRGRHRAAAGAQCGGRRDRGPLAATRSGLDPVVTSDAELASRARAQGASVVGAGAPAPSGLLSGT